MGQTDPSPLLLIQCSANYSTEELVAFVESVVKAQGSSQPALYFVLPYTCLSTANERLNSPKVKFGASMMLNVDNGSFTASVAGKMLENANAHFVLVGSKEERTIYGTTGESFKHKIQQAIRSKLIPIVCLSDTFEEHDEGLSKEILKKQLAEMLAGLESDALEGLHLLYDAAWINSFLWEQSSEVVQNAYKIFREAISESFSSEQAAKFRLIYAVPTHSPDLSKIMQWLSADGYSLGVIDLSLKDSPSKVFPLVDFYPKGGPAKASSTEASSEKHSTPPQ